MFWTSRYYPRKLNRFIGYFDQDNEESLHRDRNFCFSYLVQLSWIWLCLQSCACFGMQPNSVWCFKSRRKLWLQWYLCHTKRQKAVSCVYPQGRTVVGWGIKITNRKVRFLGSYGGIVHKAISVWHLYATEPIGNAKKYSIQIKI